MKKAKSNYPDLLKKLPAFKIAAVLLFAMFLNMANPGAYLYASERITPSNSVIKLENELGKIYNVVNLPIKIVNDIFKKEREMSGSTEQNSNKEGNKIFALLIPLNQARKSVDTLKVDAFAPYGGGKTFFNSGADTGWLLRYSRIKSYPPGSDVIRFLLLLLMLMLVLPRGIPLRTKNLIYRFCISRLYLYKDGIFYFIGRCEIGRKK